MAYSNLLVTGGAGFIGANFVRSALLAWGKRVVTLDALTYAGNLANLDGVYNHSNHTFVHGDIRDKALVTKLLEAHAIDAIVHFAAESHVDRSIDGPDIFVETNVNGTLALLNAARAVTAHKIRFLHVSTDEVYGSLGPTGYFNELSRVEPNSPYSASKAASDHLVRAYHHTYGLDTVTTNTCNNYGPYQFPEKLLPLMILNMQAAKSLPVYGDGLQRRDWIYVEDHCRGVKLALEGGRSGETYVLGSRAETSNLDIVHALCDCMQELHPPAANAAMLAAGKVHYRELIAHVTDRPGHDRRYAIDPTKSEQELGFKPLHSLHSGLRATVAWYLAQQDWCADIRTGRYAGERLGTNPVNQNASTSRAQENL
jgi:dTDP-glucose 4,6-dehydratase